MPLLKTYSLFISHAWKPDESYDQLVAMLQAAPRFYTRILSSPACDPPIDPESESDRDGLMDQLREQIRASQCVLVLGDLFTADRAWVQAQLDIAIGSQRPIIAVKSPRHRNIPKPVFLASSEVVDWDPEALVEAVRSRSQS